VIQIIKGRRLGLHRTAELMARADARRPRGDRTIENCLALIPALARLDHRRSHTLGNTRHFNRSRRRATSRGGSGVRSSSSILDKLQGRRRTGMVTWSARGTIAQLGRLLRASSGRGTSRRAFGGDELVIVLPETDADEALTDRGEDPRPTSKRGSASRVRTSIFRT